VHHSRRPLVLIAVFVAIAAAASAEPLRLSAAPLERSRATGAAVGAFTGVVLGLAIAGAVVVLTVVLSALRPRRDRERRRAPAVIRLRTGDALASASALAVALGVLVAVLALVPRDRREIEPIRSLPLLGDGAGEVTGHGSGWFVAGGLVVLGAAVVLMVMIRRGRRRRTAATVHHAPAPAPAAAAPSREPVVWAADPREAVLQAYAVGETALAERCLGRAETETPREYLARVGRVPLRTLTAGYEAARFGQHPIGMEARRVAIDAAERLERDGT
jgi:MFS family permease